jgi:hypothetical protein
VKKCFQLVAIAFLFSINGCPALNSLDPANAPSVRQVVVPAGAKADPIAGTPANPTTQPIIVNVTIPANVPAQVADSIHTGASNPVVVAAAAGLGPWGSTALTLITLISGVAGTYFAKQSSTQSAHLDSLQAATGTTNYADATAAAHAAVQAQPAAVAVSLLPIAVPGKVPQAVSFTSAVPISGVATAGVGPVVAVQSPPTI